MMIKKLLLALFVCLPMGAMAAGNLNCFTSSKLDGQYMAVPTFSGYTNRINIAAPNTTYTQAIPQIPNSSLPGGFQKLILCPSSKGIPFEACISSPTGNRCGASAPVGDVSDGGAYPDMMSCRQITVISGTMPDQIRVSSSVSGTVSLEYWKDCN